MDFLELYGKGYVNDWCISLFYKEQEEKRYRIYVTDCLQTICENTMHFLGMNGFVDYGAKMNVRWAELENPPTKKEEKKERTIDEVVDNIWSKIGGKK